MPRPALLVELAGLNGVGKSTIAPLLAQRLRNRFGPDQVAALPEKGVPRFRRRWTRLQRRLWLTTHPAIAWSAWRSGEPRDWFFALSTMGLARRAMKQVSFVVLVDQGLLRVARNPGEIERLPPFLLPDLVLHLVSDTATTTIRQLLRTKKIHTRFQGKEREIQARAHRAKLEGLPADRVREAMQSFARNFCDPPLETHAWEAACKAADKLVVESNQKLHTRCTPDLMDRLRLMGTTIETIDNSFPRTLEDCGEECLRSILRNLETSKVQW